MNQAAEQGPSTASRTPDPKRSINLKWLSGGLAAAGTVIGLLAGATSLFDWLSDKVDPPPPPPPASIDARLENVDLRSTSERLVDYLRETNQSTAGLSDYEGSEEGYVFAIRLRIEGSQGKPVALRWSVIDAQTGKRLPGPTYNQTPVVFKPRGPSQARTWPIWVPYPPRKDTFLLRATLADEKRQPLDQADSKPFSYGPTTASSQ